MIILICSFIYTGADPPAPLPPIETMILNIMGEKNPIFNGVKGIDVMKRKKHIEIDV